MIELATELLGAFAHSDVDAIARLCADDVVVWGTDVGESWEGRATLVDAFAGVFDLGVRWLGAPLARDDWVAGDVEFEADDGSVVPARVTMVFRRGLLRHAHYSVAQQP
jgi:ketosteroid isomerase-like protein